jgi:glutathione peroxidase
MIKPLFIAALFISCMSTTNQHNSSNSISDANSATSKVIYDFKVDALDGGKIDFADFKGKKILIVNTASECGFTPQY